MKMKNHLENLTEGKSQDFNRIGFMQIVEARDNKDGRVSRTTRRDKQVSNSSLFMSVFSSLFLLWVSTSSTQL